MLPMFLASAGASVLSDLLGSGMQALGIGGGPSPAEQMAQVEAMNRAGMGNAAGFTGEAAAADAQQALRKYENTNSADSVYTQNMMRNRGMQALAAAQGQADLLMRNQNNQAGNMRRDVINMMRQSGGPAAIGADAARSFGQAGTQQIAGMASQLNQNAMANNQMALESFRGADQARMADSAHRMTMAQPHLVQFQAGQGASALNSMAAAGNTSAQTQRENAPWGSVQTLLGYGASRMAGRGFDQLGGYNTNPRTA